MDARAFRSRFPVLAGTAYLNAGTDGPLPAAAREAGVAALDDQAAAGRWLAHIDARKAGQAELREGYARLLGCDPGDVALTTSTSEGLGKVLAGMGLGPGDEILTSDQEHPGLIGPLLAARERGATVRTAPLSRVADAVTRATTVVAVSHVGWISGELADPGLREVDVPVVYDGAQGAGAIPVDVRELRCEAYAAPGQKWLCGSDGTGMLYLAPSFRDRVTAFGAAYFAFEQTSAHLDDARLYPDARRHDTAALPREGVAVSVGALRVIEEPGWEWIHTRGRALSTQLAHELLERGRTVGPRDGTTLVSWAEDDPADTVERLSAQGIIVRHLPGTSYVRASVGAWNDEDDLQRLLDALG